MSRHWEDLVGPMYNTREKGCEAKVGGGVSALQRAREAEHIPSTAPWEGLWQGNLLCARVNGPLVGVAVGVTGAAAQNPWTSPLQH